MQIKTKQQKKAKEMDLSQTRHISDANLSSVFNPRAEAVAACRQCPLAQLAPDKHTAVLTSAGLKRSRSHTGTAPGKNITSPHGYL